MGFHVLVGCLVYYGNGLFFSKEGSFLGYGGMVLMEHSFHWFSNRHTKKEFIISDSVALHCFPISINPCPLHSLLTTQRTAYSQKKLLSLCSTYPQLPLPLSLQHDFQLASTSTSTMTPIPSSATSISS